MQDSHFLLYDWINESWPKTKFNLSQSGMNQIDISKIGIKTDFGEYHSSGIDGDLQFRKTVARMHSVSEDNVASTVGGSQAIFIAASMINMKKVPLVIPVPEYEPISSVPEMINVKISRESIDNLHKPVRRRESFIMSNPNNPTGLAYNADVISRMLESTSSAGHYALIDEAFMDFSHAEAEKMKIYDGIMFSNTLSKFYGLGFMRTGYVVSDRETILRINHLKSLYTGGSSPYFLWIASQVLQKRNIFFENARKVMTVNRKMVSDFVMDTGLRSDVSFGVAPYCLVAYEQHIPSIELCRKVLEKTGVLISAGSYFGVENSFRLCFTPETETLSAALEKLSSFFKNLR
ncbi:MAG: pyridoxal phosphate-dependent aminotransferase [Thermoplasmataceae archaeon]